MAGKEFHCLVCEKTEKLCDCDKNVRLPAARLPLLRLTEDGQYYCLDCREACDYKTQDQT